MAERETVVDNQRITYEGLFSAKELYKLIDSWFDDQGYDKLEKLNTEVVEPEGKYIEIVMEPSKGISDYAKIAIGLRLVIQDMKEVVVEKDKHKIKLNQGKVSIAIDGYLDTDYENRWETRPILFFIRTIVDKYIYRSVTSQYKSQCSRDVSHLADRIKSYFNMQKL